MEAAGFGRVIFNGSVAGITGGVVGPHYASSKSALHGLVHWLAMAVAGKGVTVNALAPALIEDTAMLPSGGEELAKSESVSLVMVDGYADSGLEIPVGRFGTTQEMADTVVWMIKNAYLTNKVSVFV